MVAITFPLSLANFFDQLPIQSVEPAIQRNDQIDGLENGQILTAETAPPLRRYDVNFRPLSYDQSDDIEGMIESLDGSLKTFYFCMVPRLYPIADPKGILLGSNVITLTVINANNKEITLSGFPSGYKMSRGDFISLPFGPSLSLYACHRIVQGAIANGSGIMTVEVRPNIHPGTVVATPVQIKKPMLKAIMFPGSLQHGTVESRFVTGKKFQIIERY